MKGRSDLRAGAPCPPPLDPPMLNLQEALFTSLPGVQSDRDKRYGIFFQDGAGSQRRLGEQVGEEALSGSRFVVLFVADALPLIVKLAALSAQYYYLTSGGTLNEQDRAILRAHRENITRPEL